MMILQFNRACDAAPSWTMPLREIITGQEVKRMLQFEFPIMHLS
jgi:hypothetical protein